VWEDVVAALRSLVMESKILLLPSRLRHRLALT
jgi:hypothetical protein